MTGAAPCRPILRVDVLGPTVVTDLRTGEHLRSSAARTLLVHLAVAAAAVTPDVLAAVVWHDDRPSNPVAALRNVAWRARKISGADVLLTEPDGSYRLVAGHVTTDLAEFRELLGRARSLQAVDRPAEALAALEDAVALWRGRPLAEWDGRRWAAPIAAEANELLLGAREERAALRLAVGDAAQAEAELTALCARHPEREHAWAMLVAHLDDSGRPADARRVFDQARRHLARSGLEPGAELRVALERLSRPGSRAGIPGVDLGGRRLYGREDEAAAVRATIDAGIAASRSALVLIDGEAGIGKTLLTRAVVADLQTRRRALAWFAGCDAESTLPYAPLVALLRVLHPDVTGGPADTVLSLDWLQGHAGSDSSHWQVRERFTSVLSRAAQRVEADVLVLVVDDIQWAPAPTLDVLAHILGQPAAVPVVVLATRRTHGTSGDPTALDAVQRRVWTEHVRLDGLSREAGAELFVAAGGPRERAEAAWRASGGNPFYLRELGRDGAVPDGDDRAAANDSLDRALSARVAELPAATRRILTLAATVGQRFDETLLAAVASRLAAEDPDVDPALVVDAVVDALRAGLVVPGRPGERQWHFRHDLVRRNLYRSVPGRTRARAHLAVARSLQQLAGHRGAALARIAHHLCEAWPVSSAAEAAAALLAAAGTREALLDPRTSAELAGRGLDLLAREPAAHVDLRRHLLLASGTALADGGDPDAARPCLAAAVDLIDDGSAPSADAAVAYVDTWRDRHLPDEPARLLARIAGDDRHGLSPGRCQAVAMLHAIDPQRARDLTRDLAARARERGDVDGERDLLVTTWRWQSAPDRLAAMVTLADLGRVTGSPAISADAEIRRAITAAQLGSALTVPGNGRPDEIEPRSAAAALTTLWSITACTAAGHLDRSREQIVAAARRITLLADLTRTRPARVATVLLRQSIQLGTMTGDADDTALLSRVLNVAEIPVDLESGAINTLIRARRGEFEEARAACIALVDQPEPVLMPDRVAEHASLSLACVETDNARGAAVSETRLAAVADEHIVRGEHLYLGPVHYRLGALAFAAGRHREAAELHLRSAAAAAAIGARTWQVRSLVAAAAALRPDDPTTADRSLEDANAVASRIGMTFRLVGELLPADATSHRGKHRRPVAVEHGLLQQVQGG